MTFTGFQQKQICSALLIVIYMYMYNYIVYVEALNQSYRLLSTFHIIT